MTFCDCELRNRRWNPCTGKCEFCWQAYNDSRYRRNVPEKLGATSQTVEMTEEEFLREYAKQEYPKPSVTVDLVIFSVSDSDLKVLLVRRKGHPFKNYWALPGGFVKVGASASDQGESLEQAASRELSEETGLPKGTYFLEQLYTFGNPGRDPRTRVISVSYYSLVPSDLMRLVRAGDDAADAQWFSIQELQRNGIYETPDGEQLVVEGQFTPLAFDHQTILETGLSRLRGKLDYDPTIAIKLLPGTFTTHELRTIYEAVKGDKYDASNFRRRLGRLIEDGKIEEAPGKRSSGKGRPSRVYCLVRRES